MEKERSERIEADKQIPHEIITSKTEEIEKLVEKERAERIAADAAIPKEVMIKNAQMRRKYVFNGDSWLILLSLTRRSTKAT